ncbi:MAG: SMC-Scp complex subunit ScpB [Pseudomonadota bacterium]
MDENRIKNICEAALLAADGPLTLANLTQLFAPGELDEERGNEQIREAIKSLQEDSRGRGVELKRVASGFRYQVIQEVSQWVSRLWEERPPRYTRALLETLALIAYKQPVTRGDIEQVRGVSVSQTIMRTLVEREWIKVVGHREVPGRPAEYATTRQFLDYFNLKSLNELPPLPEIRALIEPVLEAGTDVTEAAGEGPAVGDAPDAAPAEAQIQAEAEAEVETDAGVEAVAENDADADPDADLDATEVSAEDPVPDTVAEVEVVTKPEPAADASFNTQDVGGVVVPESQPTETSADVVPLRPEGSAGQN